MATCLVSRLLELYSLCSYSEGTEELAETGHQLALAYTRAAVEDKDAESKYSDLSSLSADILKLVSFTSEAGH